MWPQRPRRFAAAIAVYYGWVAYPWGLGVDFGPYLVGGHQGGLAFVGGGGKPKVSLLAKPLELELLKVVFPQISVQKSTYLFCWKKTSTHKFVGKIPLPLWFWEKQNHGCIPAEFFVFQMKEIMVMSAGKTMLETRQNFLIPNSRCTHLSGTC